MKKFLTLVTLIWLTMTLQAQVKNVKWEFQGKDLAVKLTYCNNGNKSIEGILADIRLANKKLNLRDKGKIMFNEHIGVGETRTVICKSPLFNKSRDTEMLAIEEMMIIWEDGKLSKIDGKEITKQLTENGHN